MLGYSHSKQYPYPRASDDAFSVFAHFLTQASNVDVNGTVQHIDFLPHIFQEYLRVRIRALFVLW